ncbi:hypothetical protein FFI94_008060 [Rhodococcus sp. KBS0724]|uniref:hypothetical protein n=1 Tax=Rhodococcus sp. KBS0724 TaxID=1179674 RepID=UPI00110E0D6E|nr:hypothetical protein [Rhodococcus sp. KBS0724]TSD46121.1 hypothetical protein FFI94_008060 [Rhodococcus sp. KBS0724]
MTDPTAWITQRRFDEYLVAANHDPVAARELYEWNVAISAAFFELISHVEVALRNAVDVVLRPLETPESARVAPWQGGGSRIRHSWLTTTWSSTERHAGIWVPGRTEPRAISFWHL